MSTPPKGSGEQEKTVDIKCKQGSEVVEKKGDPNSRGIWTQKAAYCRKEKGTAAEKKEKGAAKPRGRPKGSKTKKK